MLKTVDDKALIELTISNTFLNTQNTENADGAGDEATTAENDRKMMIE
jgi:hypothetical protein